MASTPEFEPGPHWRKASALTISPPLLPRSIIHTKKKLLERWNIRIYLFRTTVQPPVGDQPKVDPHRIPSESGSAQIHFLEENLLHALSKLWYLKVHVVTKSSLCALRNLHTGGQTDRYNGCHSCPKKTACCVIIYGLSLVALQTQSGSS